MIIVMTSSTSSIYKMRLSRLHGMPGALQLPLLRTHAHSLVFTTSFILRKKPGLVRTVHNMSPPEKKQRTEEYILYYVRVRLGAVHV